jgi:glutaminyl-peptide cyclotransferase
MNTSMRRAFPKLLLSLAVFLGATVSHSLSSDRYRVVHVYPHDQEAFTQGLIYLNGLLYESTGLNGRSSLRAVDLKSGAVLQRAEVPQKYFAEGLTNWQSSLVQLTWRAHTGFVYDRFSFRILRTFHFEGEGWGLTQDGHNLILSDGTSTLRFLDPRTFHEVRHVKVTEDGRPVDNLNELEYAHGEVYANIWHADRIVRISPNTGRVLGSLDLSNLLPASERSSPEAVLNGIAYDPENGHLFVTGKLWPKLFEIELEPAESSGASARRSR